LPVKHNPWPTTLTFSPDSTLLVTSSGDRINVWNIAEHRLEHSFEWESDYGLGPLLAISPDGRILAAGRENRVIVFWDLKSGRKLRTLAEPLAMLMIDAFAFSPNGAVLASSDTNGTITLWDMGKLCPE
jgi:WD40 repeat protein